MGYNVFELDSDQFIIKMITTLADLMGGVAPDYVVRIALDGQEANGLSGRGDNPYCIYHDDKKWICRSTRKVLDDALTDKDWIPSPTPYSNV